MIFKILTENDGRLRDNAQSGQCQETTVVPLTRFLMAIDQPHTSKADETITTTQ